jgi:hypothetical protein
MNSVSSTFGMNVVGRSCDCGLPAPSGVFAWSCPAFGAGFEPCPPD